MAFPAAVGAGFAAADAVADILRLLGLSLLLTILLPTKHFHLCAYMAPTQNARKQIARLLERAKCLIPIGSGGSILNWKSLRAKEIRVR